MNIHEHQAKNLLRTYGIPVSEGVVVFSPDEIDAQGGDLIPLLSSEEEKELNLFAFEEYCTFCIGC